MLVKAGDQVMFCRPLFVSLFSTSTQTTLRLPALVALVTLVAQRVVLSLESIFSDFFSIPAYPRNHKNQMFTPTRPAILASTKRAFATTPATLPRGDRVSFL